MCEKETNDETDGWFLAKCHGVLANDLFLNGRLFTAVNYKVTSFWNVHKIQNVFGKKNGRGFKKYQKLLWNAFEKEHRDDKKCCQASVKLKKKTRKYEKNYLKYLFKKQTQYLIQSALFKLWKTRI